VEHIWGQETVSNTMKKTAKYRALSFPLFAIKTY